MTHLTHESVLAPHARARGLHAELALVKALVIVAAAGWLGQRWWTAGERAPMSWQPPSATALFLIPAAGVVGLLALRLAVGGRQDGAAVQHLMARAARWATVCAGVTTGWLVLTSIDLYGGLGRLVTADNLTSVLAADRGATSQLTLVEVSLLVSVVGPRLSSRLESVGLLLLSGVALVGAIPFAAGGHGHGTTADPLLPCLVGVQALALAVWLGVMLALAHLPGTGSQLHRHLLRSGDLLSAAVLVVGTSAVLSGLQFPGLPTPPVLLVAELAAVTLVAVVGHRHRHRVAELASARRGVVLAALAVGEVVVMVAVVLLACWLPTSA